MTDLNTCLQDTGCGPDEGDVEEDLPEFVAASTSKVTKGTETEFGKVGTRDASVQWFKHTQSTKVKDVSGNGFAIWFHGIIKRRYFSKAF